MTGNEPFTEKPLHWQAVLETLARATEPMTVWDMKDVRAKAGEKLEALTYLCDMGLVRLAGRVRVEWNDNLYEVTSSGKFMYDAGYTGLRRKAGAAVVPSDLRSLAQRTFEIAPRDVFDLTRVPWTWDRAAEQLKEFGVDDGANGF